MLLTYVANLLNRILVATGGVGLIFQLVTGTPASTPALQVWNSSKQDMISVDFQGNYSGSGFVKVRGILSGASLFGAGLTSCLSTGDKLLYNASTGKFSCGTDQNSGGGGGTSTGNVLAIGDARYLRKSGDTATGALTVDVLGGNRNTVGLKVVNAFSGAVVHAEKTLTTSGTLVWEGAASGSSLYLGSSLQGAGLSDCDASSQTLNWDTSTGRFSCGTDADTDTTYTAGQNLTLNGTSFSLNATVTGSLIRFSTVSGSVLKALLSLSSSGSVTWEGAASGASLYLGGFLDGAGLASCSNATTSKLLWNSTTKRFSCGTDTDTNTTYTAGQNLLLTGNAFSLGTTITGSLVRFATLSGSVVKAKTSLASSGSLTWEGDGSGASLYIGGALQGVGLTDCDTAGTSKLLWDATTGRFSCGSDQNSGTSYTAGQGLTLTSTSFRTNSTLTGSLAKFATMTGSVIRAGTTLSSSGTLKVLGSMSGADLYVARYMSGAGLVTCNSSTQKVTWINGRFGCGTDVDTDTNTTYTAGQNLILTGNAFSLSTTITGSLVRFSTLSGSAITAKTSLASSGTLVFEGQGSGANLYLGGKLEGAGLTDCDADDQTVSWDATSGRFGCGDDDNSGGSTYTAGQGLTLTSTSFSTNAVLTGTLLKFTAMTGSVIRASTTLASSGTLKVLGNISGATLNVNGYGGFSGTLSARNNIVTKATFSGAALTIMAGNSYLLGNVGIGTSTTPDTKLEVIGTVSGSVLRAQNTLASSGSLVWEGAASGATLYLGGQFDGVGLTDCDLATQTLAWDTTTKRFSCGTDSDTTYTAGQNLTLTSTSFSLPTTITGSLVRFSTLSGSVVKGLNSVASSGALTWEGAASGASLYLGGSLQGVGLADCDTAGTSKLLWDATTGRFSCGTDTDTDTNTTYTAGQGLSLTSTSFKVNSILTGSLVRFTTLSGSSVYARTTLSSSGTLKVLGNISGATLNINGNGSFSGALGVKNNIVTKATFSGAALTIMGGSSYILGNTTIGSSAVADTKLEVIGTVSGSVLRAQNILASSGTLLVEGASTFQDTATFRGAANANLLTLQDSTNSDEVSLRTGTGDPNGSVSAQLGSLFFASDTGKIWKNNNGSTVWVEILTGSGSMHMAKMNRSAGAQSIPDVTVTKIAFDAEDFDVGGIGDFTTNDRFDILKSGKYLVTSTYCVLTVTTSMQVYIYKNGASVNRDIDYNGGTAGCVIATDVLDLVVGNYLEMYVYQQTGSAQNTETGVENRPRMSVVQLLPNQGSSFWTMSGTNLFNNNAGSVGIGKSGTPKAKLEVVGTVSGTILRASSQLFSSGTLVTESGVYIDGNTFNVQAGTNRVGVGTSLPDNALTVIGNFNVDDADTATRGYRFRTNGSSLDLDAANAKLYISIFDNGDYSGTQRYKMIFEESTDITQLIGRMNYNLTNDGTTHHYIDGQAAGDVVFNDDSTDADVTMKGDTDAGLFFLDASTDRIGVGTTAPETKLEVAGTISGSSLVSLTAVSPSHMGAQAYASGATVLVSSGTVRLPVPSTMSGFNVVGMEVQVTTAGTTNTSTFNVTNRSKGNRKVFSTAVSIDSTEKSSSTAATPPVVNASNDDVSGGDELWFDINTLSTTRPKGLGFVIIFRKP